MAGAPWSAVDDRHVSFVVTLAGGRRELVQPLDLRALYRVPG